MTDDEKSEFPVSVEQLILILIENMDEDMDIHIHVNDESWTIADLFIRQKLNNGGDGFGMKNVHEMFELLTECKQLLIENNMLSEDGYNNSDYPLWKGYDFDTWIFNQNESGPEN